MTNREIFPNFKTFITKCDRKIITKCDRYYKIMLNLLQSVTDITKCDKRLLQSVTSIKKCDS